MTVEELEIIVSAKIEQVKPQIQKVVREIKSAVKDTDGLGTELLGKIDTAKVANDIQKVKKQVKDMFDPNDVSGMKINGKSIIQGFSSAYGTLKGSTNNLNNVLESYRNKLKEVEKTAETTKQKVSSVGHVKYNATQIQNFVDNYKKGAKEAEKVEENVKKSTSNGNKLSNAIQQVKKHLAGVGNGTRAISNGLNRARSMASHVTSHLKVGLGQILKIAGSLIGIRAMYSGLRSVASSWLSSQNAQAQQLQTNIDYMKNALGSSLQPVIETIVNLIYQALKGVQSLIYALTGVNIFANASAKAYASMANNAKNTQKAMQGVADIDEIHNIQQDNSANGSGSGEGIAPNFDLSGVQTDNWMQKLIGNIKDGKWYEIGASIGKKINESLEKIPWEDIKEKAGKIGKNLGDFINGGVQNTNWELVGGTIAEGVNTAFKFLKNFLETTDFKSLGEAVSRTINGFFDKVEWDTVGQTLSEGVEGALEFLIGAIEKFDSKKVYDAIWEMITNIDWLDILSKFGELIQKGLTMSPIFNIPRIFLTLVEKVINLIVKELNNIKIKVPDWVPVFGGQEWGFELNEVDLVNPYNNIVNKIVGITDKGSESIKESIGDVKDGYDKNLGSIAEATGRFSEKSQKFTGNVQNSWKTTRKVLQTETNSIGTNTVTSITNLKKNPIWSQTVEKIKATFNQSENSRKWGNNTIAGYSSGVNEQKNPFANKIAEIRSAMQKALFQKDNAQYWGRNTIVGYKSGINEQKNPISNKVKEIKNIMLNALSKKESAKSWGSNTIIGYKIGVNNQKKPIADKIAEVRNVMQSYLSKKQTATTWGSDMMQGFINGVESKKKSISEKVSEVAKTISAYMHFSRPDKGPLRDYETWMPDMIQGLSKGLLQSAPILDNAVSQVSSNLANNLRATDLEIDVNSNINKNISSNFVGPQIENAVYSAIQRAESLFRLTINNELKLNTKTIAKEIIDDLNDEARRRGYKPILAR